MVKLQVDIKKTLASGKRKFFLEAAFCTEENPVVLFGPSGSGKTLTVHAIAGLVRPDEGRIVVGDRVLFDSTTGTDVPAKRRNIGYVFQDYALFPHLNVLENIGFGLRNRWPCRLSEKDLRQIEELLDVLDMRLLAHYRPRDLSGGQRQRVALARALVLKPGLILLDEPFSALDPLLRRKMRIELQKIQRQFHVPIILITHDPEDIDAFAETLAIYAQGRVQHVVASYQERKNKIRWFSSTDAYERVGGASNDLEGTYYHGGCHEKH